MAVNQSRANTKPSGGRYKAAMKKKQYQLGRSPSLTKLDKPRITKIRVMSAARKLRVLSTDKANIYSPTNKEYKVVKIKTITDNPANRHFIRRNIMTKGSVIDTEIGKARITSRPGQHGMVNAVLIK